LYLLASLTLRILIISNGVHNTDRFVRGPKCTNRVMVVPKSHTFSYQTLKHIL